MGSLVETSVTDAVMTICLSSPETRNALSMEMRREIGNAVEKAETD